MKHFLALAISVVAFSVSAANYGSEVSTITKNGRQVTITAVTPSIMKVTNAPVGVAIPDSRMLLQPEYPSTAEIDDTPFGLLIKNDILASLEKNSGTVMMTLPSGVKLVDNGVRTNAEGENEVTIAVSETGRWLGAGERGHSLNLAGDTLVMYNRPTYGYGAGDGRINQMNITMPMAVSDKGFALVFDDYSSAKMILGDKVEFISESSAPITYYVVAPDDEIAGEYPYILTMVELRRIIGTQPVPPLWTLGYITSKYGYKTNEETRQVVDRLQAEGYPLDGIVLDLYWYGKEQDMGRLDWDPEQWGDYKQMLADLKAKNVNLLNISQPYVLRNGRGIDNYNFLAENSMLTPDSLGRPGEVRIWVGEGGMLDVSNPATRSWLADKYSQMRRDGVAGMWGDLGEPEMHPDSLVHFNGLPARLYHNIYGNDWASIITEMMARDYPDERFMTLMRGGTIGLQRQSVFPWSGDVSRSWGGLQAQLPIMINAGMSGLGYMHHDVGGFAVDPANPVDEELYIRWLQLGLFSPILRTHAQEMAEPYNYPEHRDIILPLIKERYRWLPYNYAAAIENNFSGMPLVRPTNFFMPSAPMIEDQYLWGSDVMVAPVLEKGATSRKVTFNTDERWYDLNDPTKVYADTTVTYSAPLGVIPVFVTEGSILPMADYEMTSTADYRTDTYTFNVYPDAEGFATVKFYEDDLQTPSTSDNYRPNLLEVELHPMGPNRREMVISGCQGKALTFNIYGEKKPRSIKLEDSSGKFKDLKYSYDKKLKCVTFTIHATLENEVVELK